MSKIPKIIHYCWFGESPLPDDAQQYIDIWRKMCPDYEFMKWDESNFDIDNYKYARQAYAEKKWAFVSDVCRLEKIYEYGGVYLDVKTEILRSLDDLLDHEMVVGFEQDNLIMGAFFMAKKEHPFIKSILNDFYKNETLLDDRGDMNDRTINSRIQEQMKKKGLKSDNTYQELDQITVYPKEYFCPTYWNSPRKDAITDHTYILHHFSGSWHNDRDRRRLELLRQELLVSIVVPVYNVEKYLHACVDSLTKQTYRNIEIILVDDKSLDKSGVLCDRLAEADDRIEVIHKKKNEGLNMARKTGFEASHGQYVTFLDSDDYFHKRSVEKSLEALFDSDADVVAYGMQEFADKDKVKDDSGQGQSYDIEVLETKESIKRYAFSGEGNLPNVQYMTVWGKLYARNVIEGVDWKIANYRAYEDNFWTPQALLQASKVVLMSSILIYYRRNVAYGINGENLGNKLKGNSINGRPVGYIEFMEHVRKFYSKLARENGLDPKLDEKTNRKLFLITSWRIDNLATAGLIDAENNMEFITPFLREYILAKNDHISNLNRDIEYLHEKIDESNQELTRVKGVLDSITREYKDLMGVKRSARLFAGNIKRRLMRLKK
jgi:glycosyltransferase involved in cell wall biosynthesis